MFQSITVFDPQRTSPGTGLIQDFRLGGCIPRAVASPDLDAESFGKAGGDKKAPMSVRIRHSLSKWEVRALQLDTVRIVPVSIRSVATFISSNVSDSDHDVQVTHE